MKSFQNIGFYLFFLLIFFSCQDTYKEKNNLEEDTLAVFQEQLIHWEVMNENGWKNSSFPIWFNSDILQKEKIKKIQLNFINYNSSDSELKTADTLPYLNMELDYNQKGEIQKLKREEFFYGKKIGEFIFLYPTPPDSIGYSLPTIKKITTGISTEEDIQFLSLERKEANKKYLHFQEKENLTKINYYYIIDRASQNISFIDNKITPSEEDVIIYDSPLHYTSAFSIKNMVEKTMLEERLYNSNKVLIKQRFYAKGFTTKRNYFYDQTGSCIKFTDSLFYLSDDFINATYSEIIYKNNLPSSINFYDFGTTQPIQKIELNYILFPSSGN